MKKVFSSGTNFTQKAEKLLKTMPALEALSRYTMKTLSESKCYGELANHYYDNVLDIGWALLLGCTGSYSESTVSIVALSPK